MNATLKKRLSLEEIDAQAALELPDRRMMALVTVVITNILNGLDVDVTVKNNQIAIQVCAIVDLIDADLLGGNVLDCEIRQ